MEPTGFCPRPSGIRREGEQPDINTAISTYNITGIEELAPRHPVYLITGVRGGVVIKQESATRQAVQNAAAIMSIVDPRARTVVMAQAELAAIQNWFRANQHTFTGDAAALNAFLGDHATVWVKMEMKKKLLDLKAAAGPGTRNKEDIRKFAKALSSKGGLEDLGEIIAADAFNSNGDRFVFDGNGGVRWDLPDGTNIRLRCLLNVGNVFIVTESRKRGHVVGLDAFDPSSGFKDWDQFNEDAMTRWPGRILKDSSSTEHATLANMVVDDLETVMGPRNRKLPGAKTHRLPTNSAGRVVRGIESGAAKIRNGLKQMAAQGGNPVGLVRRLNALGWLNNRDFPRL